MTLEMALLVLLPLLSVMQAAVAASLHTPIATEQHTCFITRYRRLRCWGYESRAAVLGHGNRTLVGVTKDSPTIRQTGDVPLGDGVTVTSVAVGAWATCVLLMDETVKCWGYGADGILGDGSFDGSGSTLPKDLQPVDIGEPVRQLVMGSDHACVLLQSSNVKCWGQNDFGQLGYNDTMYRGNTPETVPSKLDNVPLDGPVKMLAAGLRHTCALMEISGDVVCWGSNTDAQLGYNPVDVQSANPPNLPRVPLPAGVYDFVACGARYSCAIEKTSRELRCWGAGSDGKLGYGGERNVGGQEDSGQALAITSVQAVPFGEGERVESVGCGAAHACALLESGGVRCFGRNFTGQLGYPHQDIGRTPTTTPDTIPNVDLPELASAVACGNEQTCAELLDGRLYCWGAGALGATGFNNQSLNIGQTLDTLPRIIGPVDVGDEITTTTIITTTTTAAATTVAPTSTTTLLPLPQTTTSLATTPTSQSMEKTPMMEAPLWPIILLASLTACCCLLLILLCLYLRRQRDKDESFDDSMLQEGVIVYTGQSEREHAVATEENADSSSSSADLRRAPKKSRKKTDRSSSSFDSSSSSSSSRSSKRRRKKRGKK